MKKRNLLDLVRTDVYRTKKPKKDLNDFVGGEEEKHNDIIRKNKNTKKETKKLNPLEQEIGGSYAETEEKEKGLEPLDFLKLNKMSQIEQIRTLKREYLELLDKLEEANKDFKGLESGVSEKSIQIEKIKKEIKALKDLIREIVVIIPDSSDLTLTIDTTSWTVADVRNDIVEKISNLINKVKFSDKVIEYETKDLTEKNKILEEQLYKTKQELKELKENGIVRKNNIEDNSEKTNEEEPKTNINNNSENPIQAEKVEQQEIKPQETEEQKIKKPSYDFSNDSEAPKYLFIEVERYIENLSEESKYVLEIIGKTGVSRNNELKEYIHEEKKYFFSGGKFLYNEMNSAVKTLKDRQFLDYDQVKLGAKGGYNFAVYELSDIGKAIFYKFTGELPVDSEKQKIMKEHASVEHGYLIKECANAFKDMGYTVYEDRESCTFKLPDNKRKVFDLVIEKEGKKSHIEVERGTHNETDFLDAMDKIYQVTNELYFIAPNEKILYNHTRGNVFKWITKRLGGFEQAKGKITMYFAKFEDVKKQKKNMWDKFEL